LLLYVVERGCLGALKTGLLMAGYSLLACVPWFLVSWRKYAALWEGGVVGHGAPDRGVPYAFTDAIKRLFGFESVMYADRAGIGLYTTIAIVMGLVGGGCLLYFRKRDARYQGGVVILGGICLNYLLMMCVLSPLTHGPDPSIRYSLPLILSGLVSLAFFMHGQERIGESVQRRWIVVVSGLVVLVICLFTPSLIQRYSRMYRGGSMMALALFHDPVYRHMSSGWMAVGENKEFIEIQRVVPEGESFLLWGVGTFGFDYRRNRIEVADQAGLCAPWVDFPFGGEDEAGIEYLRRRGLRYVIWQYEGFGVRDSSTQELAAKQSPYPMIYEYFWRTFRFLDFLDRLAVRDDVEVLKEEYGYRVIRL